MLLALYTIPPLLLSVILHEIAHGWVAEKLGDPTARAMGRITLNPLKHIDPFMTVILPGILVLAHSPVIFGGAKPVPINPMYFQNPRRGMVWVALAGPVTNIALGILLYFLLQGLIDLEYFNEKTDLKKLIGSWLVYGIVINFVLAIFNLMPIPPLDGGRIAVGLLPVPLARVVARLEPFGLVIIMILLLSGLLDKVLMPLLQFALSALP